jgi:hypothetical protein
LSSERWGIRIPRISPFPSIGSAFVDVSREEEEFSNLEDLKKLAGRIC